MLGLELPLSLQFRPGQRAQQEVELVLQASGYTLLDFLDFMLFLCSANVSKGLASKLGSNLPSYGQIETWDFTSHKNT